MSEHLHQPHDEHPESDQESKKDDLNAIFQGWQNGEKPAEISDTKANDRELTYHDIHMVNPSRLPLEQQKEDAEVLQRMRDAHAKRNAAQENKPEHPDQ